MIFDNKITRQDFEKSLKLKDLESFTDVQVEQWTKDAKELLEKSTKEELNDIEKSQLEEFMVCAPNLGKVTVVNDDLTKSLMYYRQSQVNWETSEEGEIMKSRAGTYKDTAENRKLGRVGQKFGEGKKGEEPKEEKGESKVDHKLVETYTKRLEKVKEQWKTDGKGSLSERAKEYIDLAQRQLDDVKAGRSPFEYQKDSKQEEPKKEESKLNTGFKIGEKYDAPSGMGGTLTYSFLGEKDGKLRFKNVMHKDYGGGKVYELTPEQTKSWFGSK